MDSIEFEPPEHTTCDCCGRLMTRLTRFVHRDENAFAVYFVEFTPGHQEREAWVIVGLGEWGDDDVDPEEARTAFAYRIRLGQTSYELSIVDADESPWSTTYLGRRLTKAQALAHPLLQEVFDLSDHMVGCDEPLIAFLNGGSSARTTDPRPIGEV
jgi:hypothetical protein